MTFGSKRMDRRSQQYEEAKKEDSKDPIFWRTSFTRWRLKVLSDSSSPEKTTMEKRKGQSSGPATKRMKKHRDGQKDEKRRTKKESKPTDQKKPEAALPPLEDVTQARKKAGSGKFAATMEPRAEGLYHARVVPISLKGRGKEQLLALAAGGAVRLVSRATGECVQDVCTTNIHETVSAIAVLPLTESSSPQADTRLLVGTESGLVELWELWDDGSKLVQSLDLGAPVKDLHASLDGSARFVAHLGARFAARKHKKFGRVTKLIPSHKDAHVVLDERLELLAGVSQGVKTAHAPGLTKKLTQKEAREEYPDIHTVVAVSLIKPTARVLLSSRKPIAGVALVPSSSAPPKGDEHRTSDILIAAHRGLVIIPPKGISLMSPNKFFVHYPNTINVPQCVAAQPLEDDHVAVQDLTEEQLNARRQRGVAVGHQEGEIYLYFGLLDPTAAHSLKERRAPLRVGRGGGKASQSAAPPRGVRRLKPLHWHSTEVTTLVWTDTGFLLSGGYEGVLVIWRLGLYGDAPSASPEFLPRLGGVISHLSIADDPAYALVSTTNNVIRYVSLADRERLWSIRGVSVAGAVQSQDPTEVHMLDMESVANSARSPRILLNGHPGSIQWYNPTSGDTVDEILEVIPHNHMADRAQIMDHMFRRRKHKRAAPFLAKPVLPWVVHAAMGAENGILVTVDQWKSFTLPNTEHLMGGDTPTEVIHRPSLKFWHADQSGGVRSWIINSELSSPHDSAEITALACHRSLRALAATGASDGTVKLWRLRTPHTSETVDKTVKPTNQKDAAKAEAPAVAKEYWICDGTISYQVDPITALTFSDDGSVLCVTHASSLVVLWNPNTATLLQTFLPPNPASSTINFTRFTSPHSSLVGLGGSRTKLVIAAASKARSETTLGTLSVLDLHAGELEWSYLMPIDAVAVLPEGCTPFVRGTSTSEGAYATIACAVRTETAPRKSAVVMFGTSSPDPVAVWDLSDFQVKSIEWVFGDDHRPIGVVVMSTNLQFMQLGLSGDVVGETSAHILARMGHGLTRAARPQNGSQLAAKALPIGSAKKVSFDGDEEEQKSSDLEASGNSQPTGIISLFEDVPTHELPNPAELYSTMIRHYGLSYTPEEDQRQESKHREQFLFEAPSWVKEGGASERPSPITPETKPQSTKQLQESWVDFFKSHLKSP